MAGPEGAVNRYGADAAYNLTQQPRSAWTFELELRPYGESW